MSQFFKRPFLRLALVGALAASLGLAACGRKGPLDPPPGASLDTPPQAQSPSLLSPIGIRPIGGTQATSDDPGVGPDGKPQAPKGPQKPIFLDRLLD